MKQLWMTWSHKIDALSLRERAMVFLAAAANIVFLIYFFMLNPLYARQTVLRAQIAEQNSNIAAIDVELTQKAIAFGADPDAGNRARLAALKAQVAQLGTKLRGMQKGLVAPDQMAPVLEAILRGNGKLRLLSMKSLPVSGVSEAVLETAGGAPAAAEPKKDVDPKAAPVAKPPELLYRHGVEVSMQGSYLDMINYMAALESMPSQLFWGGAKLDVDEFPTARLTLTVYTLSLDQKWMKL